MSQAYQCDRCGIFHEGDPHSQIEQSPVRENSSPLHGRTDNTGDLCKSCGEDFKEWWEQ